MSPSTVPSSHFSTTQFEAWRDCISVVFDVEPPPDPSGAPFAATVEAFQLCDMVVTDARLGSQRYVRSTGRARRDGMDHFVFNLYRTGGWRARSGEKTSAGAAGQVSVLDLSRDLVSDEPTSDLVALFVPRALVEDRLPNLSALHGQAPSGPLGELLAEYIDLLARRLPFLDAGSEPALSRATCEMLVACLGPFQAALEGARPGLELVLLRRAKRFIEGRLGSSGLGPDAVCRAVGVSRRTLYRLFAQEGGVQHYIQSRRLERIRLQLSDPGESRRISDVASEFGFLRSDHFARAFKGQFGYSAKEARSGSAGQTSPSSDPASSDAVGLERFDVWIRSLHGA